MAAKRKKNAKKVKTNDREEYFTISSKKKKKIIGILLVLFSILILLSIISYSRFDEVNLNYKFSDLFKVFSSNSQFLQKADTTRNWLGIFGAYISDFLINSTLGVFSTVFPIILFIWGASLLIKINFRKLINVSNFLLLLGIILSSFFGIIRIHYGILSGIYELSGSIGDYLGNSLSRLLGGIGAIIFLFTSILILFIIAFDINIENIFYIIKNIFIRSTKTVKEGYENSAVDLNVDDDNLKKIKKLRIEKRRKRGKQALPSGKGLIKRDAEEQTRIRIIRKDDKPIKPDLNEIQKDENKKVDLEKSGEILAKEVNREKEASLPNQWEEKINYTRPGLALLDPTLVENFKVAEEELTRNAELLKGKLKLFDIEIQDISVTPGPVVTLYEIVPAPGVKISKIVGLEHDIALALAARGIRIIAPIPGKSAIGVEIPNTEASLVNARSVLGKIFDSKYELPIALGKTISGDVYIADLAKMPHLLIAGSTGSGKSVGINMIISSLLYTKHPSEVKLIMIDPKKIELSFYNKLRKHYLAVSPDLEEEIITIPQNAVLLLKSVEYEMEKSRGEKYCRL